MTQCTEQRSNLSRDQDPSLLTQLHILTEMYLTQFFTITIISIDVSDSILNSPSPSSPSMYLIHFFTIHAAGHQRVCAARLQRAVPSRRIQRTRRQESHLHDCAWDSGGWLQQINVIFFAHNCTPLTKTQVCQCSFHCTLSSALQHRTFIIALLSVQWEG